MRRTRVKICGLTRMEDIQVVTPVEAGLCGICVCRKPPPDQPRRGRKA